MSEDVFEICNGAAQPALLLVCDHASNFIPAELGSLGLSPDLLASHIAWDIGAGPLTRALAARLEAPAVLARFSRLVVDPNRGTNDPTIVMRLADGQVIPGNSKLDGAQIEQRIARYHAPYHAAIAERIWAARAQGIVPAIVSVHSFTPAWRGRARPWQFGVLWDRDARLARPLLERFARESGIVVGDNEPYSGTLENDCMYRHGTMNGLPHALIEVRQDLIADKVGIDRVAALLHSVVRDALDAMGPAGIRFTRPLALPPQTSGGPIMDENTRTELEAAVFRRLVAHLRKRTDVQNIDMMNLAGFCRNCLGDWYREAAAEKGIPLEKDSAREIVYGMPPAEWKTRFQKEASPEALAQFAKSQKTHS